MTNQKKTPKYKIAKETKWLMILVMIAILFYCLQVFSSLKTQGLLANDIGLDFRAFWSAGYAARTYGYPAVYDLDLLKVIQERIVPDPALQTTIEVAPVSVLPVFILLFQLISLLPPVASFIIWSIINILGAFLYLRFLSKSLHLNGWKLLPFLGVLSFPVFLNFFWGQVNLLLLICVGEFIRHITAKRDFQAGLFIGGLVLKPQLLILLLPFFLVKRRWKILAGSSVTILIAGIASLLLGKAAALVGWAGTILKFAEGIPTNAPGNMMNWRMIGERLGDFMAAGPAWGIAITGILATLVAVFLVFKKINAADSPMFLAAFTGMLTATLTLTWHSHVPMGMVLIPVLFHAHSRYSLSSKLFHSWLFGIPILMLLFGVLVFLAGLEKYNLVAAIPGLYMLILNSIICVWSLRTLHHEQVETKRS